VNQQREADSRAQLAAGALPAAAFASLWLGTSVSTAATTAPIAMAMSL
jgi:hypothetical protein